jgi:hypothetical protein
MVPPPTSSVCYVAHQAGGHRLISNSLPDDQKRILSSIILDVADRAVFGFLCVLDGVRSIEDDGEKGHLELRYVKNDSTLLNPAEGEMLHDLW